MQNNFKVNIFTGLLLLCFPVALRAAPISDLINSDLPAVGLPAVSVDAGLDDVDIDMEQLSADAVAQYDLSGSVFEQITVLEQEKILMQLEKERAQLDLELDRLAAEKIKLHMEIDTLSGRAEQQQQELATATAKLEAEAARLEKEKESLANAPVVKAVSQNIISDSSVASDSDIDFTEHYKLVNVIGAGNQLQATIVDLKTGQNKRVSVGKNLDGYVIQSISLDDGIILKNAEGDVQNLNVSNKK